MATAPDVTLTGTAYQNLYAAAVVALTPVTTPDATDEATAITLANALKVKVNEIITALKA